MEQHNDILANLNAAQKAAVTDYEHPSLIVAGAGSGKTRVLTCRIAHMISQGVAPYNILALTFTNKAAREMRERIETLVGSRSRYIWMGTFHSISAKILFAEAENIGYQPSFTIYDSSQSQSLIKSIVKEMNLDEESYKPRDIQSRISFAKNNLVTADSYASNSALLTEDRERRRPEFAHIYKTYQQRCKANNAMDFDDLLLNINILFRDHSDVLEKYQQKFAYILVDEYQDTNYAQYLIIRRLAQQHSRVCVVGDDAQSIYSFRGAKIENILQFRNDFPGTRVFKLEQNYRSTQNIVNAANSVIEKNSQRIKKNVFSENETGEKIKVLKAYTDGEEAQLIADGAKSAAIRNGGNWNEIAVLYRTNAQSRAIEEALRRRDVPYVIYGGHSFYDHKEIKDMLAYFKLIINPNDDESFKRIINFPARGIGSVTVERIATLAKQKECSMWQAVESLQAGTDEAKTIGKRVLEFAQLIKEISLQRQQKTLYEFGLEVATRSGILPMYRLNPSPDSESALANIEELLNSMQDYRETLYAAPENEQMREPTIEEWLQNVSLLTDMDNDKGEDKKAVTLMTVHSAKGLEFDTVFIAGMEENLFPSIMCLTSPRQLEEERRLFYVALTRAKREATILYSETRYKWGNMEFCKPSRFIKEIDPKYLDMPVGDDDDDNDERSADEDPIAALRRKLNKHYAQMPTHKRPVTPAHGQPTRTVTQPITPRPDTSGMKRMGTRHMVHNEGESNSTISAGQYTIGQHVVHPKFGSGTIIEIEQLSNDIKLKVKFNDPSQGTKTLLSKFAKFLNI
ncbi:MAG: UvrD-helicase domain-containing protein [Tidjanibacter sp.]|nr:UvrD-helicase domain-containing protein [Tidjanibacter sp.]